MGEKVGRAEKGVYKGFACQNEVMRKREFVEILLTRGRLGNLWPGVSFIGTLPKRISTDPVL